MIAQDYAKPVGLEIKCDEGWEKWDRWPLRKKTLRYCLDERDLKKAGRNSIFLDFAVQIFKI